MTETAQYLVCRFEVLYKIVLGHKQGVHVPYMHKGVKVFTDLADAVAYRDRMNRELYESNTVEHDLITDYVVTDLETCKTVTMEV